jgi:hydroxymethylpyrimidine kinase/phosphomethylpyrimidine kinase
VHVAALTVAGSDSGGRSGLQADLRTFEAFGVVGASAVSAVTAQDDRRVRQVHTLPTDVVLTQITVSLADLPIRAVKTGMLATERTVEAVGDLASSGGLARLVVDPVLASTSGQALLAAESARSYLERLIPHALLATPNLLEAEALLDRPVRTLSDMRAAAASLAALGPSVIVTGGHLHDPDVRGTTVDVLHCGGRTYELRGPRIPIRTPSAGRGTGCRFSSAVTARLALGDDVPSACLTAKRYLTATLASALAPTTYATPTCQEIR